MAWYYRGFKLEADTFNVAKILGVRDAETAALHDYIGGPANGQIQHDGQTQVQYDFVVPFIAQLVRDEPGDSVPWKRFGIEWTRDQWPELSAAPSPWLNCGTPGAKYMLSVVLPIDTNGEPITFSFHSSDAETVTVGPFTTTAGEKTPTPMAFAVPFIAHEIQITPDGPCRMWHAEAKWSFDPWPEFITEATAWMNCGYTGAKYVRRFTMPVETGGVAAPFRLKSSDGGLIPFSATTSTNRKTPLPFDFTIPVLAHEIQFLPGTVPLPMRMWPEEAVWEYEKWPEFSMAAGPWQNYGTNKPKYMRSLTVPMDTGGLSVDIPFTSSDGSTLTLPANTPAGIKTPVPFAFTTPLIGHEFQFGNPSGPVRIWFEEVQPVFEEWPEFIGSSGPWMNFGTNKPKYLRSLTIPMETGGHTVSVPFVSSDGAFISLEATTNAGIKTPLPFSFSRPLIGHEFQFMNPNGPVRIWFDEAQPVFEEWPELIKSAGPWQNFGTNKPKYLRSFTVPMDTGGVTVNIPFVSSDGESITLTANTPAGIKTPVPVAFVVPLIGHEFQFGNPDNPVRMWFDEIQPVFDEWPELITSAGPWQNFGTNKPKYMRGMTVPMETNGASVSIPFRSSDGKSATLTAQTTAAVKTPVPFAFTVPLIGHEFQCGNPNGPIRIWWGESQVDYDEWPELTAEATGWLPVLDGNMAAFLQGLIVPIEANGTMPVIWLRTETGVTVALSHPLSAPPSANVKTPVPFSLNTPLVCHQVQLLPQGPCRIWDKEIRWVAQPTAELSCTWKTQPTAHGQKGYHFIGRIEAAYASTQDVTLTMVAFDGTSPEPILWHCF